MSFPWNLDLSRRRSLDEISVNTPLPVLAEMLKPKQRIVKKARTIANSVLRVYEVTAKNSEDQVQVLSNNTLYDLVDICFKVFQPRGDSDTANNHLWNLWICKKLKFKSTQARNTQLWEIFEVLEPGARLTIEYDYDKTTYHTWSIVSVTEITRRDGLYPRRKPQIDPNRGFQRVPRPMDSNLYDDQQEEEPFLLPPLPPRRLRNAISIDLNEIFPSLSAWCFHRPGHVKEMNFFQAGKQKVYGYLDTLDQQMIAVFERANSLGHYLSALERASATPRGSVGITWHSIVVLPQKNPHKSLPKRLDPFQKDLEAGFCDCHVVPDETPVDVNLNLNATFPKLSAFAGFRKDKDCPHKGWLRYKDRVLLLCTGAGSAVVHPNSPKGTAFHAEGPHVPENPDEDVLVGVRKEFDSLQDLFLEAERLLETL